MKKSKSFVPAAILAIIGSLIAGFVFARHDLTAANVTASGVNSPLPTRPSTYTYYVNTGYRPAGTSIADELLMRLSGGNKYTRGF